MTAVDFGMLPPEVNSARMYAGAGSESMLVAASAWKGLAAELRSTALSYGAVLTALTDEEWQGPASAAMAAAAAPYVAWMNATAAQAEQAASQAEAAAAAYEAAFAGTVPPEQIAANRALLQELVSTNYLGRNMPAISANEAQYSEMWAQDAATMYGYAASSSGATRLTPFAAPAQSTDPAGSGAQSGAVGQATATAPGTGQSQLSALLSRMPSTLRALAAPAAADPVAAQGGFGPDLGGFNPFAPGSATDSGFTLNGILNGIFGTDTAYGQFLNANIWNDIFSSGFYMPGNYLGTAASEAALVQGAQGGGNAAGGAGQNGAGGAAAPAEGAAPAAAPCPSAPPVHVVAGGGGVGMHGGAVNVGVSVGAGLGHALQVGHLSVPPGWTGGGPLSSALGATPMLAPPPTAAAPAAAVGMPGIPMGGNMLGTGYGRNPPQYGFKPTFIPRPPSAG